MSICTVRNNYVILCDVPGCDIDAFYFLALRLLEESEAEFQLAFG